MKKKLLAWFLTGMLCVATATPVYAEEEKDVSSTSSNIEVTQGYEMDASDISDDIQVEDIEENISEDDTQANTDIEDGFEEIETADMSGTCGKNLTWTLSGSILTISGNGDMEKFSGFIGEDGWTKYAPWSEYTVTKVELPEGLTSISAYAFCDCDITNIEVPSSVTCIGNNAFDGCTYLASIELSSELTSIGSWAFYGCKKLTSINIPSGVTSIGNNVFSGCSNLSSIIFKGDAPYLEEVSDLSPRNMEPTTIYYPPDNNTWKSDYIEDTCDGTLKWVALGAMSGTCGDNLTWTLEGGKLTISGTGDMEKFSGDYPYIAPWSDYHNDITEVELPAGLTSISAFAFYDCQFSEIEIPSEVTSIGNLAFEYCKNLTSIKIPVGVSCINKETFAFCSNLTSIELPSGVTSIEEMAFEDCSDLVNIEIPSGVTSIGNQAFAGCSSLTNIEIPAGVTNIGDFTFNECDSLESINIPSGVTTIGRSAFYDCNSLASIEIPSKVKSIGKWAFNSCSNLRSIIFKGNAPSLDEIADLSPGNTDVPTAIYYPANNSTWTSDYINETCDGTIKWVSYGDAKQSTYNGTDYSAVYDYYYFHSNADVAAAFGDDDAKTIANFVQWGMQSGRQGNSEFNVYIYMKNYPELRQTYGSNLASYYYHYIWWGKAAGLVANKRLPHDPVTTQNGTDYSAVYDYEYFHANSDVAKAFGDDDEATLANFVRWGMTSGRQGNEEFNVYIYMANYPELKKTYGSNLASYYYHYIWWGKAAGLIADHRLSNNAVTTQDGIDYSAVYDYDYFHSNSDVAKAFGENDVATLANFVRWGMTTGRQGSEEFNVYTYMNNYPELKQTYGSNLAGYYYHYIWWGKVAGLVANKKLS